MTYPLRLPLLTLLLLALAGPGFAALSSSETTAPDGHKLPTLESDLYRLTFDPANGGRCTSFFLKEGQREWVYEGNWAGMFLDHFAHQPWPGELLSARYEYAIERDGDRAISIRLWTVPNGNDPLTRGLKVEKIITLREGRREVQVVNTFTNPTTEGKNVAMWIQQCFAYGGQRLFDQYYRPGVAGISLDGEDDTGMNKLPKTSDDYAQDWVKQPAAGWSAGRDRKSNEGAVFLLDYNYLDILYNCAGSYTTEWFMDKVPLPPGKSWSTQYTVVPVNGFRGFTHASPRLIANVEAKATDQGLALTHQLCGATEPLGDVTIKTSVYGVRSKQETTLAPVTAAGVGLAPVDAAQTSAKPQTEPLVFRVEIAGKDWTEKYEYLYEGAFAAAGIQGAPSAPEYPMPRPKKAKTFLKPDTWTRPHNPHLRALVMYGIWTQHYQVEKALRAIDPQAEITVCDGWGFFPPTYDTLLSYDLLVISNLPAGPDYANEMVADFARHGGGVLTLGGMLTYGAGQWQDTALEGILPVRLVNTFDMKQEKAGVAVAQASKPVPPEFAGLEACATRFPTSARFFWMNLAQPKPDAQVLLTAGSYPLLVVGPCGEGRVATVLGTCHGEPTRDTIPAWRTPRLGRDAQADPPVAAGRQVTMKSTTRTSLFVLSLLSLAASLALAAEPRLEIISVKPNKIVYDDGEAGKATIRLSNPLAQPLEVTLRSTLYWDLDSAKPLDPVAVTVPAQGEAKAEVSWGQPVSKWGHEVRVEAVVNGQVVDTGRQFFGVNSDWIDMVIVANLWDWAQGDEWPFITYTNLSHWFAWAPGDFTENAPKYDEWWSGQGGYHMFKKDIQASIQACHATGVHCTFYDNSFSNGAAGVEWARKHPEWVSRDRTGLPKVSGSALNLAKDPSDKATGAEGFVLLDSYDPEMVKWGAQNAIDSVKMFGWDGLFWDCGGPCLFPGYSYDGQPAPHGKDGNEISARNYKLFTDTVRKEYPHFAIWINGDVSFYKLPFWSTFGNGGGEATMKSAFSTPNSAMLCEFRGHEEPGTEFNNWRRCYDRYAEQRDTITQTLGSPVTAGYTWGHDGSGDKGPKVTASRNYWTTGNHLSALYLSTQMHTTANPNFALYPGTQFMCRYSGLLWGRDVRVIKDPQSLFTVETSRPVWWEKGVYRRPRAGGEDVIVHLANVPETETVDIYRVPDPPAATATVTLTVPAGQRLQSVYAMQMRGWQADPGGAAVKYESKDGKWLHTTGSVCRSGPHPGQAGGQDRGRQGDGSGPGLPVPYHAGLPAGGIAMRSKLRGSWTEARQKRSGARLASIALSLGFCCALGMTLACLTASADETLLSRPNWGQGEQGLDGWALTGPAATTAADPQGGARITFGPGNLTSHKLPVAGSHRIRFRYRFAREAGGTLYASVRQYQQGQQLGGVSQLWAQHATITDLSATEIGFTTLADADAFDVTFAGPKTTLAGLQILDLGPPTEVKPDGKELIPNGGWEESAPRSAIGAESSYFQGPGWMGWLSDASKTITSAPRRVHSGKQALMVLTGSGAAATAGFRWLPSIIVVPDALYDFSAWVKGEGMVSLYYLVGGEWGDSYATSNGEVMVSPDEWRQLHYVMAADNPSHKAITMGVFVRGRVFVDDLSLRQITSAQAAEYRAAMAQYPPAPPRVAQAVPAGETRSADPVTLENAYLRAVISPVGGGHVTELTDKATGMTWKGNLLALTFPDQPWG